MEFTYRIFQKVYKKGATPLLFLSIKLPLFSGGEKPPEKINRFYRELEERVIKMAEEKLFPTLLAQCEEKNGGGGGFRSRPYHLSLTAACKQEKEESLLCERRFTLSYRGRTVKERIQWERIFPNGLLLPHHAPKKEAKPKTKKARGE